MMNRKKSVASLLVMAGLLTPSVAWSSDYSSALQLYNQKNYRGAAAKFETAMQANPADGNAAYYCALSHQLANNRVRARQLYQYITQRFSGTSVANMAGAGLKQLGDSAPAASSSGGSHSSSSGATTYGAAASGDPELARLPDEIKVPFTKRGSAVYVEVSVNNQPIMFHLDTGAFATVVGANMMEAAGMSRPNNTGQEMHLSGVGSRENVKGWRQKADLRVGLISRRDFPLVVQDHLDTDPLLGQDFLKDFDVTIDNSSGNVVFRKKGVRTARRIQERGAFDIPFTLGPGGHILVNALINNKPYKMMWDTGASNVVFSLGDLKRLGIPAPDGPPTMETRGIAGSTPCWPWVLDTLKVGKIEKEGLRAIVAQDAGAGEPLLGQQFFGEYKYEIDRKANVIHVSPP